MSDEKRRQRGACVTTGCVLTGSRNRVLYTRCATKKLPENQSNSQGGEELENVDARDVLARLM